MNLTKEQLEIINSKHNNIKINAVAGSGKTSTIIEYARKRAYNNKILYLAFNRAVKLEAIKKFKDNKIPNVVVDTIHALAYKSLVYKNGYRVKENGYNIEEIVKLFKMDLTYNNYDKYIIANYINKFFIYFCNSNKSSIDEINYLNIVSDNEAKNFVKKNLHYIQEKIQLFFNKMINNEIEVTHDFYLKQYQLLNPELKYDYIIFDEAQDASEVILDIILKQKACKVIVGDTNQQIYSFRYAINALEKTNFKTYYLSKSFRFNDYIANLAIEILKLKKYIGKEINVEIKGCGNSKEFKTKAFIARTNLGLFIKAINYLNRNKFIIFIELLKKIFKFKKNLKDIYFEGNINSLIYTSDGISLYDIINLYNKNYKLIKNKIIRELKSFRELYDYINKTENKELLLMLEIVKKYKNKTLKLLKRLKNRVMDNYDRKNAKIIFSTVHKSKGLEYDVVELADDFITKIELEKLSKNITNDDYENIKLNEEINLLYVAITRTKNLLYIPKILLPQNYHNLETNNYIKVI